MCDIHQPPSHRLHVDEDAHPIKHMYRIMSTDEGGGGGGFISSTFMSLTIAWNRPPRAPHSFSTVSMFAKSTIWATGICRSAQKLRYKHPEKSKRNESKNLFPLLPSSSPPNWASDSRGCSRNKRMREMKGWGGNGFLDGFSQRKDPLSLSPSLGDSVRRWAGTVRMVPGRPRSSWRS